MSLHSASRSKFVGRVDEVAQLWAAAERARSGHGQVVLLSGPPGIGKSTLAAEFISELDSAGLRVFLGRSWEAGGAPPYWPWVQVLRGILRSTESALLRSEIADQADDMVVMLPELTKFQSDDVTRHKGEAAPDRFRLFDAISNFINRIGEAEPLVIVLEDLQSADVPSVLLLEFVSNQLADASVLIVATYRDVELTSDHPLTTVLAGLRRLPLTSEIGLTGFDAAEVALFLESSTDSNVATTLSSALHRRTNGNPLFLGEAVRLLGPDAFESSVTSIERVAIPAEIRAVLQRRLTGLSASCRGLLEMLSVLGDEFEIDVAGRLAELSVDDLLDRLGEATAEGLIKESRSGPGAFAFTHDLVREALYANLTPALRLRFHLSAAAILESHYGESGVDHLAELAMHLFEGASGGEPMKAVEYCRRAGEQAMDRLAYEEGVRLFEMALWTLESVESPPQQVLGHLLLSLGDARVRAGDLHGAGSAFRQAADLARRSGDSRLMARAAIGYGGRFVWARAGSDTEMVPLLQGALVMLGGEDDGLRVRLLSRLACATRSVGDREHGAALARQAVALARQLDDPPTLIYALSGLAGAIWWPENSRERIEIGREMVELGEFAGVADGSIDGHMTLSAAYAELGDFAAAREELRLLRQAAGSLRLDTQRWLEGAMLAVFSLSEGSFAEAEELIDEMLRKSPVTPARDNIAAASFQRFLLRREQGRLTEIEAAVRTAATEFTWYPIQRLALADLLLLTGRDAEARMLISELSAGDFSRFDRDNYWIPSMCLASEIVVALGDVDLARTLFEQLRPFADLTAVGYPEGSLGPVARYLGLLSVLTGDLDAALLHLEAAIESNERNRSAIWLAHAHHDVAMTLRLRDHVGDLERAEDHLRASLRICDQVGMTALRESIRAESTDEPSEFDRHVSVSSTFRRDGDYFSIAFDGDGFTLKNSKGLRYVATLLGSPGREIHVMDLVAGETGVESASRGRPPSRHDNLGSGGSEVQVLDRAARDAYERRLRDLEEDIDEADRFGDVDRAAGARAERDFIATELAAAVGLGGRDRTISSDAERARINVTRAIRAALSRIHSNSETLGRHLDTTIRTGVFCSYNPDPLMRHRWEL